MQQQTETNGVRIPLRSGMSITSNLRIREKRAISLISDFSQVGWIQSKHLEINAITPSDTTSQRLCALSNQQLVDLFSLTTDRLLTASRNFNNLSKLLQE